MPKLSVSKSKLPAKIVVGPTGPLEVCGFDREGTGHFVACPLFCSADNQSSIFILKSLGINNEVMSLAILKIDENGKFSIVDRSNPIKAGADNATEQKAG